jgi:hypothetical protein
VASGSAGDGAGGGVGEAGGGVVGAGGAGGPTTSGLVAGFCAAAALEARHIAAASVPRPSRQSGRCRDGAR